MEQPRPNANLEAEVERDWPFPKNCITQSVETCAPEDYEIQKDAEGERAGRRLLRCGVQMEADKPY